jgi:hypothetical protein
MSDLATVPEVKKGEGETGLEPPSTLMHGIYKDQGHLRNCSFWLLAACTHIPCTTRHHFHPWKLCHSGMIQGLESSVGSNLTL